MAPALAEHLAMAMAGMQIQATLETSIRIAMDSIQALSTALTFRELLVLRKTITELVE